MATLRDNDSHSWAKNTYSKLSFKWAGTAPVSPGTVSVKNPKDGAATSYSVPQANIALTKSKDGKLTNNAGATIDYTLS